MSVASPLVSRVLVRPAKADKRGSYLYDEGGTQLAQQTSRHLGSYSSSVVCFRLGSGSQFIDAEWRITLALRSLG